MRWLPLFARRRALAVGFAAAVAPLVVLLGLQVRWLARLERATALAREAALDNVLEAVGTEIEYFYLAQAERAFNLHPSLFIEGRLADAAAHWDKKPVDGARRIFLVDYTRDIYGNLYVWDPVLHRLVSPLASDESLAIILACMPWQMLGSRHAVATAPSPLVDERDPHHRIVLNPILDDAGMVLGVAGMVLDEAWFRDHLLPATIAKALPAFFPGDTRDGLVVTVRDRKGRPVFHTRDDGRADSAVQNLPFAFADWTVGVHSTGATPASWARANFAVNMGLSILLALVLAGGVLLALQAADRAMRLSELKSDFVSNVSHELRTPLASIRVFAEHLQAGRVASPERVRDYGERIESESRRLTRLIDNILDFARIESGRKTYRFAPADLQGVVETVVRGFESRLQPSGFRVRLDVAADGPLVAKVDADALAQALSNLLDNAVKYSGAARQVDVRLERQGGEAVIGVCDHGIGIEPAEQRKIFDRFHRVGSALVHDVKGSGLGLSIVHHIVRAHQGRVTVESAPGAGSTFAIRLPLGAAGAAATTAGDGSSAASRRLEA